MPSTAGTLGIETRAFINAEQQLLCNAFDLQVRGDETRIIFNGRVTIAFNHSVSFTFPSRFASIVLKTSFGMSSTKPSTTTAVRSSVATQSGLWLALLVHTRTTSNVSIANNTMSPSHT